MRERCARARGARCTWPTSSAAGGAGGEELARGLLALLARERSAFAPLYALDDPVKVKLDTIARRIYGADGVVYPGAGRAADRAGRVPRLRRGFRSAWPRPSARCPTTRPCSDRPRGFKITVNEICISAGAGFLVAITGDITTMPGLPRRPNAERVDVTPDGVITGLF